MDAVGDSELLRFSLVANKILYNNVHSHTTYEGYDKQYENTKDLSLRRLDRGFITLFQKLFMQQQLYLCM